MHFPDGAPRVLNRLGGALALLFVPVLAAQSQTRGTVTPDVFRRFSSQVVKIHVIETGSAAKAELGSGFFVSASGHLVTNFHVISKLVHAPERYRAELVQSSGGSRKVEVLAVDVVHDLAILRSDATPARFFSIAPVEIRQGERLYSLGHPNDLGLSIVEGTFNGLLQHTLYPKLHFTGSINPGMSGGPTISEDGRAVGVNVSTAGNQVSFLVPIERAAALLDRTLAAGFTAPKDFLAEIGDQIRAYQNTYLADMFAGVGPTVTLGQFVLPTEPAPFFKCWADADRDPETPYQVVDHQCSTDDYVYVSADQSTGIVELDHRLLTTNELNPIRFYALYTSTFHEEVDGTYGSEEDVTPFRCETNTVRNQARKLRTVLCMRRYKKLGGLYDAVLRAAALGSNRAGLVTTLTLSGVTFDNTQRITRRFLESISWRE
ncbi:MAG TPA: serine protease [Gemmatimonadaceae bacterium]|nr:serine protease [Gemmatimonadaceae bacterium]